MLVAYAVWSTVYYMVTFKVFVISFDSALYGYYHLWFVPMMAGLYICVPVVKRIAEDESIRYYLVLAFVLMILVPSAVVYFGNFGSQEMNNHMSVVVKFLKDMQRWGELDYIFYFVLGFYLHRVAKMSRKMRWGSYCLGCIGGVLTVLLTVKASQKTQSYVTSYFENFSLNAFLMSIGVFVLFRNAKISHFNRFLAWISKYCFLIYLVHALVLLKLFEWFKITSRSFTPVLSVPLISLLVFVISFLISFPVKLLVELASRGVLFLKERVLSKKETVNMKG